jgi:hypothetical protein
MAAVLRGTKAPTWGCNCGHGGNWASRIKCRECGKAAPSRILERAKKADAAAAKEDGGNGSGRRQPERSGESSKEHKELKAELAAANKKIAALSKAGKESEEPEANGAEDSGPSLSELVALHAAWGKTLPKGDPLLVGLEERIATLRLARDRGKSISTRMLDMEKLVARKKKANELAIQEMQTHIEAAAPLQREVDDSAAAVVQAEAQLRQLRTEALLEPGQLEVVPSAIAGLESLVAGNTAAEAFIAELRQWITAKAAVGGSEAAAAAPPAAGGGGPGQVDNEDDADMGQSNDALEEAAEELAAQVGTSTGGTAEAKKKLVNALAAVKASKKKKKGGLVVQQQSK